MSENVLLCHFRIGHTYLAATVFYGEDYPNGDHFRERLAFLYVLELCPVPRETGSNFLLNF